VSFAPTTVSSAEAAIRCEGRFQIVKGQRLSTPYCEDHLLAELARARGFRISDAAIRNSPTAKADACRLVGHDMRVRDICAGSLPETRRGRGF
jgi:hypothetical protein